MAILSGENQAKMMKWYDQQMALAMKPPPVRPTLTGTPAERQATLDAYSKKLAEYEGNPAVKILNDARAEVIRLGYKFDQTTGTFVGTPKEIEEAQFALNGRLAEKRKAFESGLETGIRDQSHIGKALEAFGRFDIFTGLKQLFMGIPIVGDILATGGKMIFQLFKGNAMGPITAFQTLRKERALAGAFERVGITDKATVDALTEMAIKGAETAKAPDGSTPATGLKPGVVTAGQKANGTAMIISDELKPFADEDKSGVLKTELQRRDDSQVVMLMVEQNIGGETKQTAVFYVGHKEGNNFVVDSLIMTGKDQPPKKVQSMLAGKSFAIGTDGAISVDDQKKMMADIFTSRDAKGNTQPLGIVLAGSRDKAELPPELAPAMTELGWDPDNNIGKTMKKVADTGKTPQMLLMQAGTEANRRTGAYVGYIDDASGKFVVTDLVMVNPTTGKFANVELSSKAPKEIALDANKMPDATLMTALQNELLVERLDDGKVKPPPDYTRMIEDEKVAIKASTKEWAEKVLGKSGTDVDTYVTAKLADMTAVPADATPASSLETLTKRKTELQDVVTQGTALRHRFDELQKMKTPDITKENLDKAWGEFVSALRGRPDPVNLDDLKSVKLDTLKALNAELETQTLALRQAAAMKDMNGKVFDGKEYDKLPALVKPVLDKMPEAALKELKANKFIVVTEGDKTAIYIGDYDDTNTGGMGNEFKVNKVMQLKGGAWVEGKKLEGGEEYLALKDDGQTLADDALSALKKFTRELASVTPPSPDLMKPVSDLLDPLRMFTDAVAVATRRFPPGDGTEIQADMREGGNSALPKLIKSGNVREA